MTKFILLAIADILVGVQAYKKSACSSGIYKTLSPLSEERPIQSYCSSRFPVSPVTSTTYATLTATVTDVAPAATVTTTAFVTTIATATILSYVSYEATSATKTDTALMMTLTTTGSATTTATAATLSDVSSESTAPDGTIEFKVASKKRAYNWCANDPVASSNCSVECGVDHPGGGYAQMQVASFQKCMTICEEDDSCVTAQYHIDNGYCYLKNALNPATKDNNVDSVTCRKSVKSTTTTKAPHCATTTSPTTTTTTTTNPLASLTTLPGSVIATFCSCIESTPTNVVTITGMYTETVEITAAASTLTMTSTITSTTTVVATTTCEVNAPFACNGDTCSDLVADYQNCGTCGQNCADDEYCYNGTCRTAPTSQAGCNYTSLGQLCDGALVYGCVCARLKSGQVECAAETCSTNCFSNRDCGDNTCVEMPGCSADGFVCDYEQSFCGSR